MTEIKNITKAERAEMWQQVAAYVEQLEQAVETQRAQLKRRQERINRLKARIRAERTCKMELLPPDETRLRWLCSECSGVHIGEAGHYLPPKYCPNCGSRVIGADE